MVLSRDSRGRTDLASPQVQQQESKKDVECRRMQGFLGRRVEDVDGFRV